MDRGRQVPPPDRPDEQPVQDRAWNEPGQTAQFRPGQTAFQNQQPENEKPGFQELLLGFKPFATGLPAEP
jgi:hypothetical protein